jgi:tetratricopeptide (TPR) repeat protein
MSHRPIRALWLGLCWIAAACATTTTPASFVRTEEKARRLGDQGRWAESLRISEQALARCNEIPWCRDDKRFQGAFENDIGAAEERLDRRDLALPHYRKAFNAYPLYFSENYFRVLRDLGMFRQLRSEIDVKLASQESTDRATGPMWSPTGPSGCSGRFLGGNYSWRLRADGQKDSPSGKAVVSQSGCTVSADLAAQPGQAAAGPLRLRGDISTGDATVLYGPPCVSSDRGRLTIASKGFTVSADRAAALAGCAGGHYLMDFTRD